MVERKKQHRKEGKREGGINEEKWVWSNSETEGGRRGEKKQRHSEEEKGVREKCRCGEGEESWKRRKI